MKNHLEILSLISGKVNKELLFRNEFLAAENRILRSRIEGELKFTLYEKMVLSRIAVKIARSGRT